MSQRRFEQFADAVDETARTGTVPDVGSGPSAVRLALPAVRAAVGRRAAALRSSVRARLRRGRQRNRCPGSHTFAALAGWRRRNSPC